MTENPWARRLYVAPWAKRAVFWLNSTPDAPDAAKTLVVLRRRWTSAWNHNPYEYLDVIMIYTKTKHTFNHWIPKPLGLFLLQEMALNLGISQVHRHICIAKLGFSSLQYPCTLRGAAVFVFRLKFAVKSGVGWVVNSSYLTVLFVTSLFRCMYWCRSTHNLDISSALW